MVRIETEDGEFEFIKTSDMGCSQCDMFERCHLKGSDLLGCRAYLCELLADVTGIFKLVNKVENRNRKEEVLENKVYF